MADAGIDELVSQTDAAEAKLHGFAVNSAELAPVHKQWLEYHLVPILGAGGSVTVLGMASRTGSAAHNQKLSERRAQAVIDYLRSTSLGRGIVVESKGGVGESAAAQEGMRDGSESSLFRAVLVTAWHRSVPPPPPKGGQTAGEQVKRVTSRHWHNVSTGSRGGGNPWHDGGGGAFLAEELQKLLKVRERGGTDTRSHAYYPKGWLVNRVHDRSEYDDTLRTGPVITTVYDHRVTYEWGAPTPQVILVKEHVTKRYGAAQPSATKSTKAYPRSEIWKQTIAPDAKVWG